MEFLQFLCIVECDMVVTRRYVAGIITGFFLYRRTESCNDSVQKV